MCESEVKSKGVSVRKRSAGHIKSEKEKEKNIPLVPLLRSGIQINILLLLRHASPDLLPCRVPPHIVELNTDDEDNVPSQNTQQHLVSASVKRLIIISVNLFPG